MSCDVARFTITKGLDNNFVFTIKADGSTLPMEIVAGSDTFTAKLVSLSSGSIALTKDLTIVNAVGGKVSLTITSAEAASLTSDKGSKVDRYYLLPTYKLLLDCRTTNNGNFIAKVPEVYVD